MQDEYDLSISRTADNKFIITPNPDVSFSGECINQSDDLTDKAFIRLDVTHDGKKYPIWFCDTRDKLDDPDLERLMTEDKKPEIIQAFKQWRGKAGNGPGSQSEAEDK
jgi:hypothetical protein